MTPGSAVVSLSGFAAAYELRRYLRAHPAVQVSEAVESLRNLNPSATAMDFTAGILLHEVLPGDISLDLSPSGMRETIRAVLNAEPPSWLRLVPHGRERVRTVLLRDEVQCFREAGLFDPVPDDETLGWWDHLAARQRADQQTGIMEQAREAERLSLSLETEKLKSLQTFLRPEWVSLEDNSLGYDIRSYDLVDSTLVPRLIEVKSTKNGSIHISRNEWSNAITSANYVFHVWQFPERTLTELQVVDLEQNVPTDRGDGAWESVLIRLGLEL